MAIYLYTPSKCGTFQLVELNRFSKKMLKWKTSKFFAPEVNNFYGCKLQFSPVMDHMPASQYIYTTDPAKCVYYGYFVDIVKSIAPNLNYSGEFHCSAKGHQDLDFVEGNLMDIFYYFFTSSPTLYGFYGILVPPGAHFTSLEKLFLLLISPLG